MYMLFTPFFIICIKNNLNTNCQKDDCKLLFLNILYMSDKKTTDRIFH